MGGSIAIGHPFAATGARLVTTLANEMRRRDVQFGLMSVCAQGGMGCTRMSASERRQCRACPAPLHRRAHDHDRERHRRRHARPAGRAGEHAHRRGAREFEALLMRLRDEADDPRGRAHLRQAGHLHRRRRHRGVHRAHHPAEAERLSSTGQEMLSRLETLPQAGRRRDPRRLPRRRARAGARLPLPHRHRSSEDPARPSRGAARRSFPARAAPSGCRGSSACAQRST